MRGIPTCLLEADEARVGKCFMINSQCIYVPDVEKEHVLPLPAEAPLSYTV